MIECTFEDGNKAGLRHVTVEALVEDQGKILIIRRSARMESGGLLALPGGYLDRDETTKQGAARETREETGYEIAIQELLSISDDPDRRGTDRQNVSITYTAKPISKVGEHDPHEVDEVLWVPIDQIPDAQEFAFDHYKVIQEYVQKHHG